MDTNLFYKDRTWSERPQSFDTDKADEYYFKSGIELGTEYGQGITILGLREGIQNLPKYLVWFNTWTVCFAIEVERDQDLIDLVVYLSPYAMASSVDAFLGNKEVDFEQGLKKIEKALRGAH